MRTFTSSAARYKYAARLTVHWAITGIAEGGQRHEKRSPGNRAPTRRYAGDRVLGIHPLAAPERTLCGPKGGACLRIAANALVPGLGSALRSRLRVGSHPDADAGAAFPPPLGRFSRFYRCYGGGPAWIVRRRWPRRQA